MLIYDGHIKNFDDRAITVLWSNYIQTYNIKAYNYANDYTNDIGTNLRLKGMYGNARVNWKRNN